MSESLYTEVLSPCISPIMHASEEGRIEEALAKFLAVKQSRSRATADTYRRALKSWFEWLNQCSETMYTAKPSTIEGWLASLGLAPSSTLTYYGAISSFYKHCCRPGEVLEEVGNPCEHVNVSSYRNASKQSVKHCQALTDGQLQRLLKVAEGDQTDWLIVTFLAVLGLRVSELTSLNVSDYIGDDSDCFINVTGKSGSRTLSIPVQLCEALHFARSESIELGVYRAEAPLIPNRRGERFKRQQIQTVLDRLSRRAKLAKPVTPHQLRATSITRAIELDPSSLKVVMKRAGHSRLSTTESYITVRDLKAEEADLAQTLANEILV